MQISPWKKIKPETLKCIQNTKFGAVVEADKTTFSVFATEIEALVLELHKTLGKVEVETFEFTGEGPIYTLTLPRNCHGQYYQYNVKRKGQWYRAVDPWAQSMTANSALGMILKQQDCEPEGFRGHKKPQTIKRTEAILYETHIRDTTVGGGVNWQYEGKYLGMIEKGRLNRFGEAVGLDHLKELGITHVHLLPLHDMGSVDELTGGYNWGYDPMFFMAPEGSYATDPIDGKVRVREMKAMIKGLHEAGLGVVLDVVYNHTYVHEDHPFEILAPGWYYRKGKDGIFGNGSGCGNETASESPLFRKYVLDSLKLYLEAYEVDGFRFDLLALHDQEFVREIEAFTKAIKPEVLLYGEPWTGGKSLLPKSRQFRQKNQKNMTFAVFNDHLRNALKGDNDGVKKGFVSGGRGLEQKVATGITGGIFYNQTLQDFTERPGEAINYASCHDNLCLYDKLKKVHQSACEMELSKRSLLALSIVMTSFGTPFIQGGTEFMRTKNGDHNSFISGDQVNALGWERKNEYKAHYEAVKKLISLRKQMGVFAVDDPQWIRENLIFIQCGQGLIAYCIRGAQGSYLVVHYAGKRPKVCQDLLAKADEVAGFGHEKSDWKSLYDSSWYFDRGREGTKPNRDSLENHKDKNQRTSNEILPLSTYIFERKIV